MKNANLGKFSFAYNDLHDIAAILEVAILNVYSIRKIGTGDIVLDLGAGIGEFAVLCSKRVGETGLVVSVEPNPSDYTMLNYNLTTNNCRNVVTFKNAISSTKGKVSLKFKGQGFTAEAITYNEIANCLREYHRDKFDAIKMDIEGGEIDALLVLKNYLPQCKYIMIELHGTKKDADRILEPLGFSFRRLKRVDYIMESLFSFFRHPVTTVRLWKIFNSTGEDPGFRKILKGIEIAKSDDLMVGVFENRRIN